MKAGMALGYAGFRYFTADLGLLNGLSKVKRTGKVVDDFDFLYFFTSCASLFAESTQYKDFVVIPDGKAIV